MPVIAPVLRWIACPSRVFVLLALVFGALFLFTLSPARAPDERGHLFRIMDFSQGLASHAAQVRPELKLYMDEWFNARFTRQRDFAFRVPDWWPSAMQDDALGVTVPAAAILYYSPVPYLPAIPVAAVMEAAAASPLSIVYAVRAVLCLASIIMIAAAIRITPVLKWQMALLALVPGCVFIRSSITADSLTIGYVFLFIALVLRLRFDASPGRRDRVWAAVLACCVALSKAMYLPVLLLWFLVPVQCFSSRRDYWRHICLVVLLPVVCAVLWTLWMHRVHAGLTPFKPPGVNEAAQLMHVLQHPLAFLSMAVQFCWSQLPRLFHQAISGMGLLDISLPVGYSICQCALLCLLPAGLPQHAPALTHRERLLAAVVSAIGILFICFLLYLTYTEVGAHGIGGTQGRYFLPWLIPFLIALYHIGLKNIYFISGGYFLILYVIIQLFTLLCALDYVINHDIHFHSYFPGLWF